jgi:thiol:disulfide interchange protein
LAYVAGTTIGTGALGALLLAIRAGGDAAGWAFQLQEPKTILLLLLLAVGITLNLLGLFLVPAMGGRARPTGGFATGALAAFVATPCAGPFLGAALGTALLLPPIGSLAVFGALGLGLGLPFVLVAFVPAIRSRLPKPGPWMARLQKILAIPMALSAAACLWLLWRVGGLKALEIGLVSAAALSLCLVGAGLLQRKGKQSGYWAAMAAVAIGIAAVSATPHRSQIAVPRVGGEEPWSEAAVAKSLREGHLVFVYFTADWCLTCKVNEAAAIDRTDVRDAFRRAQVHVYAGDWTNGDPEITRFLESRERAGVPLYLWYKAEEAPEELPQLLTPLMLISRAQAGRR